MGVVGTGLATTAGGSRVKRIVRVVGPGEKNGQNYMKQNVDNLLVIF